MERIKLNWWEELKEITPQHIITKKSSTRLQMFLGFFVAILLTAYNIWKLNNNPEHSIEIEFILIFLGYSAGVVGFNELAKSINKKGRNNGQGQ